MNRRTADKIVKMYEAGHRTHRPDSVGTAFRKMGLPVPGPDKAPVVPKPVDVVNPPVSIDFKSMKVAELKSIAKERGLSGYSSMKKADLIDALSA